MLLKEDNLSYENLSISHFLFLKFNRFLYINHSVSLIQPGGYIAQWVFQLRRKQCSWVGRNISRHHLLDEQDNFPQSTAFSRMPADESGWKSLL